MNLTRLKYIDNIKNTKLKINETYTYNLKEKILLNENKEIKLSIKENKFIQVLLTAKGAIVKYDVFDELLWYEKAVEDSAKRQFFYRLNTKLPNFPFDVVRNIGYKIKMYPVT